MRREERRVHMIGKKEHANPYNITAASHNGSILTTVCGIIDVRQSHTPTRERERESHKISVRNAEVVLLTGTKGLQQLTDQRVAPS
jgi:hypothetical protein